MAEVFICKKGTVDARGIRDLRNAGVIVVQAETPERCTFIRSSEVVSSDDMLWAALAALKAKGQYSDLGVLQRETFALRLFDLVNEARNKRVGVVVVDTEQKPPK